MLLQIGTADCLVLENKIQKFRFRHVLLKKQSEAGAISNIGDYTLQKKLHLFLRCTQQQKKKRENLLLFNLLKIKYDKFKKCMLHVKLTVQCVV